jgi:signal transduction histidine kinase
MSDDDRGARDDAKNIAATLRQYRREVIDHWIALTKHDTRGVPRAAALSREELEDFVPVLLDELVVALERIEPQVDATEASRDEGSLAAAIHHAEHRAEQGYSITEVIRELGHFRVALQETLAKHGTPLSGAAGRLVHGLVDHAIGGGAESMEHREVALVHAERRRIEAEKQRVEADHERIEALIRAKDDFTSMVSHELRAPLHVIIGWTQLARAREPSDPMVGRALETIERSALLQSRLIEDMLEWTRLQHGQLRLERVPFDPLDAVRAAIEDLRPTASARHIEVALHASAGGTVSGDPDRLHQVFVNLLSNALKFSPDQTRIEIDASRVNGSVRVAVHDDGAGIAPELLPVIFDPFRQGEPGAGKRQGGVGLGLAVVRELVQMHGGHVHAESAGIGQGATFVVELPVV